MASETSEPIRRGRGLRITVPPAQDTDEPSPPPSDEIVRGRGLRLSTAASTVQTATVRTEYGPLRYLRVGEGPPLIAVHGFGASGCLWRDVLSGLADIRTGYALDLPGCGESPARSAAPTLAALADEVIAFADALGLRRFDLIGHALGAGVAAVVAATRPARVGRLILTSFGVRTTTPDALALALARAPFDIFLGLARPVINTWAGWVLEASLTGQLMAAWLLAGPPADPVGWDTYLSDHARADGRMYVTMQTMPADPTLKRRLQAITAPTVLIGGQADRIIRPNEVQAAAAFIPAAKVVFIPACGHLPSIEHPVEYQRLVREGLAG